MDIIPTASDTERAFNQQLLATPLPDSADLFDVVDLCCAFAGVLIETEDRTVKLALCGRLAHALVRLEACCDSDLPEPLVAALTVNELPPSALPDCWADSFTLTGYAKALTATLIANVMDSRNEAELAGLLHDLVHMLAEQLKTPCWVRER